MWSSVLTINNFFYPPFFQIYFFYYLITHIMTDSTTNTNTTTNTTNITTSVADVKQSDPKKLSKIIKYVLYNYGFTSHLDVGVVNLGGEQSPQSLELEKN